MRNGEQYGLQRPDVDLERRRISVRETKNGEVRHIPMNDDVYGAFKALLAMHLSRKNRAEDMPNQSLSDSIFGIGDNKKWWIETLKKTKVKNYRWHDNRHTFCSRLAQAGARGALSVSANAPCSETSSKYRCLQLEPRKLKRLKVNTLAIVNLRFPCSSLLGMTCQLIPLRSSVPFVFSYTEAGDADRRSSLRYCAEKD